MLEEIFDNKFRCIGLLFVYIVLLRDSCGIVKDIFVFLDIPYDLAISYMELGPMVALILSVIWFYGCCVALYLLGHGIANTLMGN